MPWHAVEYRGTADGEFTAEGRAGADSLWFSGHFPDAPILPGIAQLAMVRDVIRERVGDFQISEIRRVRFKQMIRPGDSIRISVRPSGGGTAFSFRLTVNGEPACTGTMTGKTGAGTMNERC